MPQIPSVPVPLSACRALALHAQLLDTPPAQPATPQQMVDVVRALGSVQIDTLHMVARSQYLLMWSRIGQYKPADFDALIFDPAQRQLFEYWRKAANILPLEDYRYSVPGMQSRKTSPSKRWKTWLSDPQNSATLAMVRQQIQQQGGQRTSDFAYDGPKRDSWWDWKPAKSALEYLFDTGEVMITNRVNFHRVYDLTERVLPDWVDTTPVTEDEANRYHVEKAVHALGICEPAHITEYAYMRSGTARAALTALIKAGTVLELEGYDLSETTRKMVLHRDHVPALYQALDNALPTTRTTFLSPFDSLFWAGRRDETFWGFAHRLEAYKREPDRIWGYYCMPVLHGDQLVGRFDPRLDRKTGTLYLRTLHLEPGVAPDDSLVSAFCTTMHDFMAFHDATTLSIAPVGHEGFAKKVMRHFG